MDSHAKTLTMSEAARLMAVSPTTVRRLVRDGELPAQPDPLDRRRKLIRRADLEPLLTRSGAPRRFHSDGIDTDPVEIPSDRIKGWVRATGQRGGEKG